MNSEIVAVNVVNGSIFDYLREGETESDLLARALKHRERELALCQKNVRDYPDDELQRGFLDEAIKAEYRIMSYDDYLDLQRHFYLDSEIKEVSAEEWQEMLNILPPYKWCSRNGVEMFCNSEMEFGTYTMQYARRGDRYFGKVVDSADESTWIDVLLNKKDSEEEQALQSLKVFGE